MKAGVKKSLDAPIRVGISTCLLGQKVRFDAGHKRDRYITDILGEYFQFVPVCPELEIGMGVPREAVRLVGDVGAPRMVGGKSGTDWTSKMVQYSRTRVGRPDMFGISGYILKKDSPTCGMARVKVYRESGMPEKKGKGLYAGILMEHHPLLPVEEEGRLNDGRIRENFIERVFTYHRWQTLVRGGLTRGKLVQFHTVHKYLVLAHSASHYKLMGQLVAQVKQLGLPKARDGYAALLMEALSVKTTARKNVNVLLHILGFLKGLIGAPEKKDILLVIEDYRNELVPLVVPVTLIRHYVIKHGVEYIRDQVYLNPHPKELMLRNHA
ncbi:MAG TPA: DUF523 and DUF1722 domain-containing protein [Acidobacteriota bacterium]|nr:DUF523 and DUF1722 domain-containing protein [Acidobacteriota bacterium]